MELTPWQLRSTLPPRVDWPEGDAGDRLASALCQRFAQLPDVRWAKVAEVTARLAAVGAPAAVLLADMLLADMLLAELSPGRVAPGAVPAGLEGRPELCSAGCARVCGCKSMPVAGETTHVRRPVVVEHGAA